MPRIRITTPHYSLSHAFALALHERGFSDVIARVAPVDRCSLTHRHGIPFPTIASALETLEPFQIDESDVADLEDGIDLDLTLGAAEPLTNWSVTVFADSRDAATGVCARLNAVGFRVEAVWYGAQSGNLIRYGGASPFARRLAAWCVGTGPGTCEEESAWPASDNDIWLYVQDPAHVGKRPRELFPVKIVTDDPESAKSLEAALADAGFQARVRLRDFDSEHPNRFHMEAGPLSDTSDHHDASDLATILQLWLDTQGVDRSRFPLDRNTPSRPTRRKRRLSSSPTTRRATASPEGLHATVDLPLTSCRRGEMRAYAGSALDRFSIRIVTDDPTRLESLTRTLGFAGFADVSLSCSADSLTVPVTRVTAPQEESEPALKALEAILLSEPALTSVGVVPWFRIPSTDDDSVLTVELPLNPDGDETRKAAIATACAEVRLVVMGPDERTSSAALAAFSDLGFGRERAATQSSRVRRLVYGGASPAAVLAVAERIALLTGRAPALVCEWGEEDKDIFVELPKADLETLASAWEARSSARMRAVRERPGNVVATERSFLVAGPGDSLQVGRTRLDAVRDGSSCLVPAPEEFEAWCLDESTCRTLSHVAWSVVLGEPCLLEGPSGTSKTSCIRYLASRLGQPVLRLNLNGQTDAGELMGRFVPDTTAAPRGKSAAGWVWQDGPIPRALREGWWVILDELNLAEPQIVERLNSLLEEHPSLVVTENDGLVFGPRGHAVHPRFRIFATMNPRDYAGRAAMSPAFLDRWRGYLRVEAATEQDHLAFLRCAVLGDQPSVVVGGMRYRAQAVNPAFGSLAPLSGIEETLERLARFHASAEASADAAGDGNAAGAGPITFTRRALVSVLRYVRFAAQGEACPSAIGLVASAVERYYFSRATSLDQLEALRKLAEAAAVVEPPVWDAVEPSESEPESPVRRGLRALRAPLEVAS
jgi:MoxR-like ATPase